MDLATVIGMGGAFVMVAVGIALGGGSLASYLDASSILITVGGSFFAVMASNPLERVKKLMTIIMKAVNREGFDPAQVILTLLSFSEKARREGLLSLEDDLDELSDVFLKSGIQLVVDGTEPDVVRNLMGAEISALDERHKQSIKLVDDLGALCPAFGMIGTLIGLIVMMGALGGDAAAIGKGMAAALLTTLYGAVLANCVFVPISNKLNNNNDEELIIKEIVIEGVLSIQAGDNPRLLQQKLVSYFSPDIRTKIYNQIGE